MKNSWVFVSIISGLLGGILSYIFTKDWKISLAAGVFTMVIVFLRNPKRRFMRAFYIILFTLIAKIWFLLDVTTTNFDFKIGLNKLNNTSVIILGCLALLCLILDFISRENFKSSLFTIKKNKSGNIEGDSNHINQSNG
jgi:lysylphosphatidylglycerol synthetase-like protein (DUF2156 family)